MKLSMLAGPEVAVPPGCGEAEIAGITADSREVRPGWLFAALAGAKTDGARFVSDAVSKGAAAILMGSGAAAGVPDGVPVLLSPEPRRALALMAARLYPAQPETTVAVTGTSGKTSVAEFTRQIFGMLGRQAASLGTIGLVKPSGGVYGGLTTPDPVALHRALAELAGEGITHLAFEASSHGLDQYRLDGVRLMAAAFTNLGRDHLDYHPSMAAYLAAKLRLFTELLPPGRRGCGQCRCRACARGDRGRAGSWSPQFPRSAESRRDAARSRASPPMALPSACASATTTRPSRSACR